MKHLRYIGRFARHITILLWIVALGVLFPSSALAHDQPSGANLVLADWTFFVFLTFGIAGLAVMILAYKTGYLFNLEDAKYPMMLIPEEDYYTPAWALQDSAEEGGSW